VTGTRENDGGAAARTHRIGRGARALQGLRRYWRQAPDGSSYHRRQADAASRARSGQDEWPALWAEVQRELEMTRKIREARQRFVTAARTVH
jgi:hypothetical protein